MNRRISPIISWTFLFLLLAASIFYFVRRDLLEKFIYSSFPNTSYLNLPIQSKKIFVSLPLAKEDVVAFVVDNREIWVADKDFLSQKKIIWSISDSEKIKICDESSLSWSPDGDMMAINICAEGASSIKDGLYFYDGVKNEISFLSKRDLNGGYFIPEKGVWSPNSRYYAYIATHLPAAPLSLYLYDTVNRKNIELDLSGNTIEYFGLKGWDNFNNLYYLVFKRINDDNISQDVEWGIARTNVENLKIEILVKKRLSEGRINDFVLDLTGNFLYFNIYNFFIQNGEVHSGSINTRDLYEFNILSGEIKQKTISQLPIGLKEDGLIGGGKEFFLSYSPKKDKFLIESFEPDFPSFYYLIDFKILNESNPNGDDVEDIDIANRDRILDWHNNDTLIINSSGKIKLFDLKTNTIINLSSELPGNINTVVVRPTFAVSEK